MNILSSAEWTRMNWFKRVARESLIRLRLIPRPELIVRCVGAHPPPDEIMAGVIYLVRSGGFAKWAVFRCPRNEDEIIQLALMPNRRPRWTVTSDFFERPTIHPSVRQLDGSYAHFWVRGGTVAWCADSGQRPRLSGQA
jgi:hypothetical protein